MAVVRHFAINLVRHTQIMPPERSLLQRRIRTNPAPLKPISHKLRRKMVGGDTKILSQILNVTPR